MEITKEYLDTLRDQYIQQKSQMLANASAIDGAIQNVDVLIAKLAESNDGISNQDLPTT